MPGSCSCSWGRVNSCLSISRGMHARVELNWQKFFHDFLFPRDESLREISDVESGFSTHTKLTVVMCHFYESFPHMRVDRRENGLR